MASGLTSPLGIAGIIFIIIGIIMAIIGIILLIINQNNTKEWYIWVLLVGGIIIGIIGAIMLAVAMAYAPVDVVTHTDHIDVQHVVQPPVQPVIQPVPQPVHHFVQPVAQPVVAQPVVQPVIQPAAHHVDHVDIDHMTVAPTSRRVVSATPQFVYEAPQQIISSPAMSPTRMSPPMQVPREQIIGAHSEIVSPATFDPDPQVSSYETRGPAQRIVTTGPYGPGGQPAQVTGVYKPPIVRQYVTRDVGEHPVRTSF